MALRQLIRRWPHLALGVLFVIGLVFSLLGRAVDSDLDAIKQAGRLIVVTRNSPTTYFLGREGTAEGFEVDLTEAFAASLGVNVEYLAVDSVPEILSTIESGEAHIAAAGLTVTAARQASFRFTAPYMSVHQVVVCREGEAAPSSVADLVGLSIAVTKGSSYAEALTVASREVEGLQWEEPEDGPETLMQRVWDRELDCTIADDPIFQVTRRHFPELVKAFDLTEEEPVAWIVAPGADGLADQLNAWLEREGTRRNVDRLGAAHFGFFPEFDYVDLAKLRQDIANLLPTYERDLRTAARRNNLPWRLLAAIGYQESRWNPDAVSATGVEGFMMLTRSTAERVGVPDRTDAKESIWGGARYFNDILSRLPDDIVENDRYWFALAAYNMGLGHIYDARALAERQGLNKNIWVDVKKMLKHLSDEKIYPTLRHGYARGYEARRYVEHVRTYWHILKEQR